MDRPPLFLANNVELWQAWSNIQDGRANRAHGLGWRIRYHRRWPWRRRGSIELRMYFVKASRG